MAKKAKINPAKIHLEEIKILKAQYLVGDSFQNDELEELYVGHKSESGFNIKENAMQFKLFINVEGLDKEKKVVDIRAEYIILYTYKIDNLKDFISAGSDEKGFSVDISLGATIAGISYSTARGIILDRTQATEFNGVLLPVIDPKELVISDSFSLD